MKRKLVLLPSLLFLFSCGGGLGEGFGGEDSEFGEEEHITGFHYQGRQCTECHWFGGGTIFTDLRASDGDTNKAAVYHTVKLLFSDGSSYKAPIGRGNGNFQLPSNLKSPFTVIVLNGRGEEVNRSLDYSHTADRYNCNSCHTQNGANGAPGRIVNYDYYGGGK